MKYKSFLFILVCLVTCMIPSMGMLFFPTTETTENKAAASVPALMTEEGTFNIDVFNDFEDYFNKHIALRNQMIYADAKIQTTLFHTSNVDGVIYGTDGWLYYSSTLDDYLGKSVMSERKLYNLSHNFSLVQKYLEERQISFLLTIPPNKNTLYGDHMPYYDSYIIDCEHSAKLLAPFLAEQGVPYLNLFDLFQSQNEVLYLLRDSHWNMKGACLVYNEMMDTLQIEHEDYSLMEPVLEKNENGDLNRMLYSFYGKPEADYSYNLTQEYVYMNSVSSVEDGWIITGNENGTNALLMFRDSFANTLIPFLSEEFERAYFSKGLPNALERYVEEYSPDYVVIEVVERNIDNYLNTPPILTAVKTELPEKITISSNAATAAIEVCENDVNYYQISGTIPADRLQDDSVIVVKVNNNTYSVYQTDETGYLLYLKKDTFLGNSANMEVYIVNGDDCIRVLDEEMELP